jgi:serine/threonine protein kinase
VSSKKEQGMPSDTLGQTRPGVPAPPDESRLTEALQEYLAALEAGQAPERQVFLARYPDIAAALATALEGLDLMHTAAAQIAVVAEKSAIPVASTSLGQLSAGMPLGDYRIVREIGRGGMGIVYEAQQLSLRRRVALKVLPFAAVLDPRQFQRFQNEAQAAACLHHKNIVPIFAVGCERGVHYYAMQYIEGQTLAALIHELRQQEGVESAAPNPSSGKPAALDPVVGRQTPPRDGNAEPLSAPAAPAAETGVRSPAASTHRSIRAPAFCHAVAQWGIQAAEALDHAHRAGIVHRDIKPANLLVDGHSQVWITDFGLAHVQGDARLTMTGDLVGTYRYMSPEQAAGGPGVDHRTDIYSLGATLYELLTLKPAFDGKNRQELLRQIDLDEPAPPRRHNPAVPVDLETIVLKAMAKRADERYATAGELAEDLRRFLEQKAILARRPTLRERAGKWSRRHKAVVASAVVMLVLLAVGFAASTVLIAREQANTRAAYDRLAEEQSRTQAAYKAEARNFQQARRMLDFFTQVSADELANKPEAQEVRRKLLQAALDYYQDFIQQRPDDPSTREELVRSHLRVASLLNRMGAPDQALAALEQAPDPELQRLSSALRLTWLRNGGPLLLLEQPSVQEELILSEEQARQVTRLARRRRAAFWDSPDLSLQRWRTKFEALAAQEKAVLEGLGPEQAQRLKQIAWQEGGASAFSDPELLEALGLTKEQKDKIRAIQDEARRTLWVGPRSGGPRPEDWKKAADSWTKARDQVVAVLTADQKARWKELTGEPFKGEIRLPFPSSFGLRPSPWSHKKP